jgi:hypothetical protein
MTLLQAPFDEIVRWVLAHPIDIFVALTVIAGILKALSSQSRRKLPRAPAPGRPLESDLEERVRRNFEEMLRRRAAEARREAAAAAPAPPQPARPAPRGEPTSVGEGAPRPARRPVVDYDERARPEPTSTEGPRREVVVVRKPAEASTHLKAAEQAVRGTLRTADAWRIEKRKRRLDLRRLASDRTTLRRVVLLREVLDPPVALRD